MIVGKLDNAVALCREACRRLGDALATQRGSKEAREEADMLRRRHEETCVYCGEALGTSVSRHAGSCHTCSATISRMLMLKSKIVQTTVSDTAGLPSLDSLKQLSAMYYSMLYVPYALRGATGNTDDIREALDAAMAAAANLRIAEKEQRIRNAGRHVVEQRKKRILDMLVDAGADPDSEETDNRVNEIYYDMYG